MSSSRESFWRHGRYAVVGHGAKAPFPKLTYLGLKRLGKKVFAVDPSAEKVEGDRAFDGFGDLPAPVEAVVLEVPREETAEWVRKAAEAGVRDLWIHMNRDTPEALAVAEKEGLDVRYGTCAVMYVTPGVSMHSPHRWIMKVLGKY